jgi:hypothetical protein
MKDLRVGDEVQVDTGDKIHPAKYEAVYAFALRDPELVTDFLQIFTTENGQHRPPLEITKLHLVHVEGHSYPVQASTIRSGDVLFGDRGTRLTVTNVKSVVRQDGAYAPLTPSGKIVVDGIQASAYASLQKDINRGEEYAELANSMILPISQQTVIHMHLSLYRMMCLGVSPSLCDNDISKSAQPAWVEWGIKLVALADEQIVPVQMVMGIFYLLAVLPFYAIEVTFGGPKYAPLILATAVLTYIWKKQHGRGKEKAL